MGGYVDELSQVVITQHRPQTAHLSVRTIIMVKVKITSVHNLTARTGVFRQKLREFLKKHGVGQFVAFTWWQSIQTHDSNRNKIK